MAQAWLSARIRLDTENRPTSEMTAALILLSYQRTNRFNKSTRCYFSRVPSWADGYAVHA